MNRAFKQPGIILVLFFINAFACSTAAVAQTAERVEAIRKLVQKTNRDIDQAEQSPGESTVFLTELAVNKNLSPYPAVGIYKTVIRFYYTFGDREIEPYPNRLLKIINSTDRSNRKEYSEFVLNETEQLVFYFEKKDDIERRVYFSSEKPFGFIQGVRLVNHRQKEHAAFVTNVLKEKANLVAMFRRSLRF